MFFLIALHGFLAHLDEAPVATSDTFFSQKDSLATSSDLARGQVRMLTDIVLQHQATWAQMYATREDLRMQVRNFYAVIFAGLLSAALIAEGSRKAIGNIVLIMATLMYALDVHMLDNMKRQEPDGIKLLNTLQQLIRVAPDNTRWYSLTIGNKCPEKDKSWDNRWTNVTFPRLWGKLIRALKPNFEQIVFYFVPILLLAGFRKKLRI